MKWCGVWLAAAVFLSGSVVQSVESGKAGSVAQECVPASVLDLSSWKLTLPIPDPKDADKKPNPWELGTPDLATFSVNPWFTTVRDADGMAVQFRAGHGAVATSGSKNSRSELREMTPDYPKKNSMYHAAWGLNDGKKHQLTIRQKVTQLTSVKPHTVCGQIHDAKDDVTVFRVEGNEGGTAGAEVKTAKIWITDGDDSHAFLVESNYVLGTVFEVKFIVADGVVGYAYNGTALPYTQSKTNAGCYFKAGNYTQSNAKTAPEEVDTAYAETRVYKVELTHE